jgi:hypothetical protein
MPAPPPPSLFATRARIARAVRLGWHDEEIEARRAHACAKLLVLLAEIRSGYPPLNPAQRDEVIEAIDAHVLMREDPPARTRKAVSR